MNGGRGPLSTRSERLTARSLRAILPKDIYFGGIMARWTALFLLTVLSQIALADTQVIFSADGSKATVTMLAVTTNPDAVQMYNDIAAPPQNISGRNSKRIDFVTADGIQSLDISCVFSQDVNTTGSCVLVLHASPNLTMQPAQHSLSYQLQGPDAQKLYALFVPPTQGSELFRSSDNLLVISAASQAGGAIDSLTLTYGNQSPAR
jgi:hypothetical protein